MWILPTPSFPRSNRSSGRGLEAVADMNRDIQVKTNYTVTSEPANDWERGCSSDPADNDGSKRRNNELTDQDVRNCGLLKFGD